MCCQNLFEIIKLIVLEWDGSAGQLPRHTERLEPGDQVAVKRLIVRKVGGQLPVVRAMIATKRDKTASRITSCDPYCHSNCFGAAAGVSDTFGTRDNLGQQFSQLHFIGIVELQ